MRILSIFFWIIVGAVILWFFKLNLDQEVNLHLIFKEFEAVNLATIIFFSLFVGVILGAVFMAIQYFKAKAQVSELKKEIKDINQQIEKTDSSQIDYSNSIADEVDKTEEE